MSIMKQFTYVKKVPAKIDTNFNEVRNALGWTYRDTMRELDVSYSCVWHWCSGAHVPHRNQMKSIQDKMNKINGMSVYFHGPAKPTKKKRKYTKPIKKFEDWTVAEIEFFNRLLKEVCAGKRRAEEREAS